LRFASSHFEPSLSLPTSLRLLKYPAVLRGGVVSSYGGGVGGELKRGFIPEPHSELIGCMVDGDGIGTRRHE